jgi:D-alanine--poly(phosphoribitol) ligase subunit 1
MINSCILFLEEAARRNPHKIALVDEKSQYTFAELREHALRFSRHIPGDWRNQPIAVYVPKSADCVIVFLGILYSGNFYVPLDTKSPAARLKKMLTDLGPKAIVASAMARAAVDEACGEEGPPVWDLRSVLDAEAAPQPVRPPDIVERVIDTDPIYCIYTSGSTGSPKGVVVSHRSVADFIDWATERYELDEATIFGNQSPFHFDVSVLDIFGALKTGGTMVVIPEHLFAFPAELLEFVKRARVNFIIWVPSVLIHIATTDTLAKNPPTEITKVLFAGEPMPAKHLNYWMRHLHQALFSNLYGPTEAAVIACYYVVDRQFSDQDSIPIGHACRNIDLLVLNDAGEACAVGEVGELHIRGSALAFGYWNDQARTDEVFIQNPLNRHFPEKVYRTGDLVKLNERGELLFLGRRDSQIKYSGYRIELGDIESAAMCIEGVSQASALFDEDGKQIVLSYVSGAGSVNEASVRRQLAAQLPKYMVPALIRKLDVMPLTPSGKVDKMALRKQSESPLRS